jgi:hypothetical protein
MKKRNDERTKVLPPSHDNALTTPSAPIRVLLLLLLLVLLLLLLQLLGSPPALADLRIHRRTFRDSGRRVRSLPAPSRRVIRAPGRYPPPRPLLLVLLLPKLIHRNIPIEVRRWRAVLGVVETERPGLLDLA